MGFLSSDRDLFKFFIEDVESGFDGIAIRFKIGVEFGQAISQSREAFLGASNIGFFSTRPAH